MATFFSQPIWKYGTPAWAIRIQILESGVNWYSFTQHPTLPSRLSIWSFTWQGLETLSWSSSCSLDRPTPQRCWICSCQPLETGHHPTVPWCTNATARAGYVTTMTFLVTDCRCWSVFCSLEHVHFGAHIVMHSTLYCTGWALHRLFFALSSQHWLHYRYMCCV